MVKKILLYSFITLSFLFLLLGLYVNTNELSQTRQVLASTQNELTTTQADLALTKSSLTTTEIQLSQTKTDLATTQTDLVKTQNELQDTSSQLQDTTAKLAQTQADYTKASQALDSEKKLAASLQISLNNLQVNYSTLTSGVGYVLNDPTYQQIRAFLAADNTDSFAYVTDDFVCHDFAAQVAYNAKRQKIRCGYVLIDFTAPPGHAIIAFNTTDKGLVYIEPQTDEVVNLAVGRHYWASVVSANGAPYLPPDYDDTVKDTFILW